MIYKCKHCGKPCKLSGLGCHNHDKCVNTAMLEYFKKVGNNEGFTINDGIVSIKKSHIKPCKPRKMNSPHSSPPQTDCLSFIKELLSNKPKIKVLNKLNKRLSKWNGDWEEITTH